MLKVSEYIEDMIYRYKHEMIFSSAIQKFNAVIDWWCAEQLEYRYCKSRHIPTYDECRNELKCLNDYEDHLCITLEPGNMFDVSNDNYFAHYFKQEKQIMFV